MKFNENIYQYLNDFQFSNGLSISICEKEDNILSRFAYIEKLVTGKNVIHVGCCDHRPLIEHKIRKNTWLHKRIVHSANHCVGIDINSDGIAFLKDRLQYQEVYCSDITIEVIPELLAKHWDYMILGEILEHVENPVDFLKKIQVLYKDIVNTIIISVPNAFSFTNFQYLRRNCEIINTDHKYWFTPYTLAKVITKANCKVDNFIFVDEFRFHFHLKSLIKIRSFLNNLRKNKLLRLHPCFRDTIIIMAKLK